MGKVSRSQPEKRTPNQASVPMQNCVTDTTVDFTTMAQLNISAKPRVSETNRDSPPQNITSDRRFMLMQPIKPRDTATDSDHYQLTAMNPEETSTCPQNAILVPQCHTLKASPIARHRRVIFPTLYEDSDSGVKPTTESSDATLLPTTHRRVPSLDSYDRNDMNSLIPCSPMPKAKPCHRLEKTVDGVPIFPKFLIPSFVPRKRTTSLSEPVTLSSEKRPDPLCIHRSNSDTASDQISPVSYKPPRLSIFPRQKPKVLEPILRHKKHPLSKSEVNSEESIPSLASSAASEDECHDFLKHQVCRHALGRSARFATRAVCFDPRVWIREFERSKEERACTWYSSVDMDRFKRAAIDRVYQLGNTELVPTGTGRLVRRPIPKCKALFTNPALTLDGEDDDDEISIQRLSKTEMKSVLIVDPHDICLKLFSKAIKSLLPHIEITTARSSDEATKRMMEHKRFDMVIVEERLGLFHGKGDQKNVSGSALIQLLASQGGSSSEGGGCGTLWIAVSAHFQKDEERMSASGADFMWAKPPPNLNVEMRNKLLKALLIKRGKEQTALTYFGV